MDDPRGTLARVMPDLLGTGNHGGNPRLAGVEPGRRGAPGAVFEYRYDVAGRLDQVKRDGLVTSEYTYDANGNRLSKWTPAELVTADYDAQDRVLRYGDYTYTYTANGETESKANVTTGEVTTYDYDEFGNLIAVALPDGTNVEYVIDGQHRRVGKKVNGVHVQAFLYENQLRVAAVLDGAGSITSLFVYSESPNSPDYAVKGATVYRVMKDHLGSPRVVVDTSTGAVAQRMEYDEFGVVTSDVPAGFQPFGFAGGIYDQHTKLVRFGARDYFKSMPMRMRYLP